MPKSFLFYKINDYFCKAWKTSFMIKIKGKHLFFFLLLTMFVIVAGALFKINHLSGANFLLLIGLIFEAIDVILLIAKYGKKIWKIL